MATSSLNYESQFLISGVNAIAIHRYFDSFNREEFAITASLFSVNGKLYAPFSELIVGQDAIQNYLETEAKGMKLKPNMANSQCLGNGQQVVQVFGDVKTSLFKVNVGWQFLLTQQGEIEEVIVKLLASAQELLGIRAFTKSEEPQEMGEEGCKV